MRAFLVMLCLLLQCAQLVLGAPQAESSPTLTSEGSSAPRPSITASSPTLPAVQRPGASGSTTPTATKRPVVSSGASRGLHRTHPISIIRPTSAIGSRPLPFPTTGVDPPPPGVPIIPINHGHHRGKRHPSVITIVFSVLGGVAGILLMYALIRCLCSYRKTPRRDRVTTLLDRHYLEREMEERERANIERRMWRVTSLQGPPPPPYQHAPAYEEVPTSSPPPSPPLRQAPVIS